MGLCTAEEAGFTALGGGSVAGPASSLGNGVEGGGSREAGGLSAALWRTGGDLGKRRRSRMLKQREGQRAELRAGGAQAAWGCHFASRPFFYKRVAILYHFSSMQTVHSCVAGL